MTRFSLTIPGEPVPQQRARRGRNGWYTPDESAEYQERIRAAWEPRRAPLTGPVTVSARFYLARKPSHLTLLGVPRKGAPAYPNGDLDNFLKGLLDGLQPHALANDSQVVCFSGVHKLYADAVNPPRTVVDVWEALKL